MQHGDVIGILFQTNVELLPRFRNLALTEEHCYKQAAYCQVVGLQLQHFIVGLDRFFNASRGEQPGAVSGKCFGVRGIGINLLLEFFEASRVVA